MILVRTNYQPDPALSDIDTWTLRRSRARLREVSDRLHHKDALAVHHAVVSRIDAELSRRGIVQ